MRRDWIRLYRKLRKNPIWKKKPFTKGQAWVDLLLRANYIESSLMIGNQIIKILPGQIFTSEKHLAEDWGWSRQKVRHFEGTLLVNDQICTPKKTSKYTILTITNWERDQSSNNGKDIKKDIKRTSNEHQKDTSKNYKNLKNDKESTTKQKEKIVFNFNAEKWQNIKTNNIESWNKAYPACDIKLELIQMKEWILSNPSKRKKNYRRFITNWLSRSQEKGGSKKGDKKLDERSIFNKALESLSIYYSKDKLLAWLNKLPEKYHSEFQKYPDFEEVEKQWKKQNLP